MVKWAFRQLNSLVERVKTGSKLSGYILFALACPVLLILVVLLLWYLLASIPLIEITKIMEVLSPILYTTSITLALITLYYTHLKGPRIYLANRPNLQLITIISPTNRLIFPGRISTETVTLVLQNAGSRAGALLSFEVVDKATEDWSQFAMEDTGGLINKPHIEVFEDEWRTLESPIPIRQGEVRLLRFRLDVSLKRKLGSLGGRARKRSMPEAIEKLLKEVRDEIKTQEELLLHGRGLASIQVKLTSTGRIKEKTETISLGALRAGESLCTSFRSLLENWDSTQPMAEHIAHTFQRRIAMLSNSISMSLIVLSTPVEKRTARRVEFERLKKHGRTYERLFELWSPSVARGVEELAMLVHEFNIELDGFLKGSVVVERLKQNLEEKRVQLKPKFETLQKNLEDARREVE